MAQKIQEATLAEAKPEVLVIDFFRGSAGNSSRLGTLVAGRFSDSLSNFSRGLRVLGRRILKDYLSREWTTLEDLSADDICLRIGREWGATGVITGGLYQENGLIALRACSLTATEQTKDMLFQRGPNYARADEELPDEPGILKAGIDGAGFPKCLRCPDPQYSDAARAAKAQGTVHLSVVVTAEGKAASIYVLKGAPSGLTASAIRAVESGDFKPAEKDGKPVSVRVPIETTFCLF